MAAKILAVLSAALLVGAVAVGTLGPQDMSLGEVLTAFGPSAVRGGRDLFPDEYLRLGVGASRAIDLGTAALAAARRDRRVAGRCSDDDRDVAKGPELSAPAQLRA